MHFIKDNIVSLKFITGINNYDPEDPHVIVSYNSEIHSVDQLVTYTNLEELYLEYTLLPNIPPLPKKLEKLSLHQSSLGQFTLRDCTLLKYLDISCTGTEDIKCLRRCKLLEHLNCDMTNINCIYPLLGLTNLRVFSANRTLISSIRGLKGSRNKLERLDISSSAVEFIDILSQFTKLKYLNIGSTVIKSLRPLKTTISLETINMEVTEIKSLVPLASCLNLRSIDIGYTYVDLSEIKLLDRLRESIGVETHLDLRTTHTPLKRVLKTLQIVSLN